MFGRIVDQAIWSQWRQCPPAASELRVATSAAAAAAATAAANVTPPPALATASPTTHQFTPNDPHNAVGRHASPASDELSRSSAPSPVLSPPPLRLSSQRKALADLATRVDRRDWVATNGMRPKIDAFPLFEDVMRALMPFYDGHHSFKNIDSSSFRLFPKPNEIKQCDKNARNVLIRHAIKASGDKTNTSFIFSSRWEVLLESKLRMFRLLREYLISLESYDGSKLPRSDYLEIGEGADRVYMLRYTCNQPGLQVDDIEQKLQYGSSQLGIDGLIGVYLRDYELSEDTESTAAAMTAPAKAKRKAYSGKKKNRRKKKPKTTESVTADTTSEAASDTSGNSNETEEPVDVYTITQYPGFLMRQSEHDNMPFHYDTMVGVTEYMRERIIDAGGDTQRMGKIYIVGNPLAPGCMYDHGDYSTGFTPKQMWADTTPYIHFKPEHNKDRAFVDSVKDQLQLEGTDEGVVLSDTRLKAPNNNLFLRGFLAASTVTAAVTSATQLPPNMELFIQYAPPPPPPPEPEPSSTTTSSSPSSPPATSSAVAATAVATKPLELVDSHDKDFFHVDIVVHEPCYVCFRVEQSFYNPLLKCNSQRCPRRMHQYCIYKKLSDSNERQPIVFENLKQQMAWTCPFHIQDPNEAAMIRMVQPKLGRFHRLVDHRFSLSGYEISLRQSKHEAASNVHYWTIDQALDALKANAYHIEPSTEARVYDAREAVFWGISASYSPRITNASNIPNENIFAEDDKSDAYYKPTERDLQQLTLSHTLGVGLRAKCALAQGDIVRLDYDVRYGMTQREWHGRGCDIDRASSMLRYGLSIWEWFHLLVEVDDETAVAEVVSWKQAPSCAPDGITFLPTSDYVEAVRKRGVTSRYAAFLPTAIRITANTIRPGQSIWIRRPPMQLTLPPRMAVLPHRIPTLEVQFERYYHLLLTHLSRLPSIAQCSYLTSVYNMTLVCRAWPYLFEAVMPWFPSHHAWNRENASPANHQTLLQGLSARFVDVLNHLEAGTFTEQMWQEHRQTNAWQHSATRFADDLLDPYIAPYAASQTHSAARRISATQIEADYEQTWEDTARQRYTRKK